MDISMEKFVKLDGLTNNSLHAYQIIIKVYVLEVD